MRFGVLGHTIIDTLLTCDSIPRENSSSRVREVLHSYGGIGANIAAHAANMGLDVRLYSLVGEDLPPDYREHLAGLGVDLSGLTVIPGTLTPRCWIASSADQKQIALVHQGPYAISEHVRKLPSISDIDVLHISSGPPRAYLDMIMDFRGIIHFDPAQELHYIYDRSTFLPLFDRCDTFFCNVSESRVAMKLLGVGSEIEMAAGVDTLILTRGAAGVTVFRDGKGIDLPAYPTRAVDSTGSGDAFRAGYMLGLDMGEGVHEAALRGCALASFVVEEQGCQSVLPAREDVEKRLGILKEMSGTGLMRGRGQAP